MTNLITTKLRGLCSLMAIAAMILMSACNNVKSDPETETKLDGYWITSKTENGEGDVPVTVASLTSFNSATHEFTEECNISSGYSGMYKIATVSCRGQWIASKEKIKFEYDKDSFMFDFSDSRLDSGEQAEFKLEMLEEIKKEGYTETYSLIEYSDDSLVLKDEDGVMMAYTKVPEKDMAIYGTWATEDNHQIIKFNLLSHTFKFSNVNESCTTSIEGRWSATRNNVEVDYDKSTCKMELSDDADDFVRYLAPKIIDNMIAYCPSHERGKITYPTDSLGSITLTIERIDFHKVQ